MSRMEYRVSPEPRQRKSGRIPNQTIHYCRTRSIGVKLRKAHCSGGIHSSKEVNLESRLQFCVLFQKNRTTLVESIIVCMSSYMYANVFPKRDYS